MRCPEKPFYNNDLWMAEGVGFEPTVRSRVQRFSSLMAAVLPCIGSVGLVPSRLRNQGLGCQAVSYRRISFWPVRLQIGLQRGINRSAGSVMFRAMDKLQGRST